MSAAAFAKQSFDYIIVGGGTAGLVLAARLSEDPNVTVGVLEAGENHLDDVLVDAPNLFMQMLGKEAYDWKYKTVPQKNGIHGWVRGKMLGGSSGINFNMFSMASRQDLDNWVELGNEGWGFDDLAPYYRKFEQYHAAENTLADKINNKYLDKSLRGTEGPIHEVWPKTCLNAGYPMPKDPRTGSAIGGFNQLLTVNPEHARRSYAAREYYQPNAHRENLSVLTGALVTKIELEKNEGEEVVATGVSFSVKGTSHTVHANKEVIVCGGTVNSPQVLELSGIGSRDVLGKAGVKQVVELPSVGENLNDHTACALAVQVKDEFPTGEALLRNPELIQQAMQAYLEHKTGPFASATSTTGFASLSLVDPHLENPRAHIESLLSSFQVDDPAGRNSLLAKQLENPKEAVCQTIALPIGANITNVSDPASLFVHDAPGNWLIIGACSTRSLSRGSIHISSSNPTEQPTIDPAYNTHPLDVDLQARSILHVASLANVEPLASHLVRDEHGDPIVIPNMREKGIVFPKTLGQARKLVEVATVTEYHPIGTCAMLPREKGGVVNAECRVYGTKNVRVVDASVFPTHVQGNIVSLVYAVAENAADIIKREK
ncbi:GMC oxidoreductase [Sporormia fimetaria CBS 119925]|uniref:GMC oxidoreductase n=1 Tax=Sporormia fimetaria CBS 119925 TaxID=1340428 RepID=A0A6A6VFI2_9PLEO|nr:GMC oxidoreductase [Sporormia fimetaria CBS 119925]